MIHFLIICAAQGYGLANHAESRKILLTAYPDYQIEISDEGY